MNHFDLSTVLFHSSYPVPSDLSPAFNLEVPQLRSDMLCKNSRTLTPPFRPSGIT